MTSLCKDMNLVLNRYCKRESLGEINFDKKQKESGIKVRAHLIHQHSNKHNKKDKLKIITQISHSSEDCVTPIPSTDRLLFTSKEDSSERSQHSSQIADFFTKFQKLTHFKSKSLDNDREYNNVGKKTSLKRLVSSRDSLSSQINQSTLNPSNEKLGQINKKKFSTKNIFKGLFSSSKSQKKNEVNLKEIDKLARFEAQSGMATSTDLEDKEPIHESKKNSFILNFNQTMPFKSHQIGEKLPPLHKNKKKKKVPYYIDSIISSQSFLPKANSYGDGNNNIKDKKHIIDISNNAEHKRKRLDAEISQNNEDEQTDCNCTEKRLNLIHDVIHLVSKNLSAKVKDERAINAKKMEIKLFDSNLNHFKNCHVGKNMKENDVCRSPGSWRQSQASLYSTNSCLLCSDDPIPNISPLLKQLESEDAIDCPVETIEYFIQAACYKHFEQGLKYTIGTNCTIENVALLHYLTRRIVKHIGDPSDEDNKKIKKILKYSEKFLKENYYPHQKCS